MKSKQLNNLIKDIPIEIILKVYNEMAFINLITELGYRKDKMWTDDEKELYNKIQTLAKKHTDDILDIINDKS